jgi:hypothetical protein
MMVLMVSLVSLVCGGKLDPKVFKGNRAPKVFRGQLDHRDQ